MKFFVAHITDILLSIICRAIAFISSSLVNRLDVKDCEAGVHLDLTHHHLLDSGGGDGPVRFFLTRYSKSKVEKSRDGKMIKIPPKLTVNIRAGISREFPRKTLNNISVASAEKKTEFPH